MEVNFYDIKVLSFCGRYQQNSIVASTGDLQYQIFEFNCIIFSISWLDIACKIQPFWQFVTISKKIKLHEAQYTQHKQST